MYLKRKQPKSTKKGNDTKTKLSNYKIINNMETTLQTAVYRSNKGTPVTDSLKVADVFGKQHKNVLQQIRNMLGQAENSACQKWFYETIFLDAQNKPRPMYVMNRDGFSLLAMGLTGAKAMKFKVAFIEQFNKMELMLQNAKNQSFSKVIPQTFSEALRLAADQADKIAQQEKQLQAQAPKVLFTNAVETSKDSILIGELAKILCQNSINIGEKRLFQWLRSYNYLCSYGSRRNQPMQKYVEMGLFEIKKTTITKPNGDILVTNTTRVTGKGQVYFVNKFLYNKMK